MKQVCLGDETNAAGEFLTVDMQVTTLLEHLASRGDSQAAQYAEQA